MGCLVPLTHLYSKSMAKALMEQSQYIAGNVDIIVCMSVNESLILIQAVVVSQLIGHNS